MTDSLKNELISLKSALDELLPLKNAMNELYYLAQEGKNDSARCGNYSMLIGFYESTIKLLLSDRTYRAEEVLKDLEAAKKFFDK